MKTIKLTIAAALIAIAVTATAVERPRLNLTPVNSEQAILSVSNDNAAYIELGIYATNGRLVYYKQTNEPLKDYKKVYDFKDLEKGNYVLSLKINDTQVTNDFEVTGNGIKVGEKKIKYDPYFSFENDEMKLSYLNFEQENLKLQIYSNNGLLYEKYLGNEFNISQGLNLAKLDKGIYTVVLNSLDKEFSYIIKK